MAACAIANIVKSSLGPVGLDKMLVDDVGVSTFIFIQCSKLGGAEGSLEFSRGSFKFMQGAQKCTGFCMCTTTESGI